MSIRSNRQHGFRRAAALALALGASSCGSAAAGPATVSAATRLQQGDAVIGALPMDAPMHVVVGLKMRDRAALVDLVNAQARAQKDGQAIERLSRTQVMSRFAPTQAQADAVAAYLRAHGFENVVISPSRMLVSADGSARTARAAFSTTFARVRTQDGRLAYANTLPAHVPATLGDKVMAVLGLQTVHVPASQLWRFPPNGSSVMNAVTHDPVNFPAIYSVGTGAAAAAIPVGIVTEGDLTQVRRDLNTFTDRHGMPRVVNEIVNTGGASSDASNGGEWSTDSQALIGMAGGVSKLYFYDMPGMENADLTANFDTIVNANAARVINVSLGECEHFTDFVEHGGDGSAAVADGLFLTAVAQGQTFVVSSGDTGADACGTGTADANWPANSPWVVAVGGTHLDTSGPNWTAERAWSYSGGAESIEDKPAWQGTITLPGTITARAVPDVSYDADPASGAWIFVDGSLQRVGGTSLSAPLFAGASARVLQARRTIGFAGPLIYALPAADFHDIVAGNNRAGESGVGYDAGAGYDFPSGRGSMKIADVVRDVSGLAW